jgi:photosystem II stability/assembly factor-like uncharacterized protein
MSFSSKEVFAMYARSAFVIFLWASSAFAGVGIWTRSGPDGASLLAVAADPSNPATVYAATTRTIYKSVDGGRLWAPTGLPILPGGEGLYDRIRILTTPEPSVVYAVRIPYERLFRTENAGDDWVERPAPAGTLTSMTVDPNDPMTLYAVTTVAIHRSTNGGDAWERLTNRPGNGVGIHEIAVDPADSRVLYAAVFNATLSGVYRSSDRGGSWNRTALREPVTRLLFDPSDRSRLFALAQNGLHATTNAGQSWTRLAPGSVPTSPTDLAIDPADSTWLYVVAGGVIFRSSNGGQTFAEVPKETLPQFVETIAVSDSSAVIAGSAAGISRSEDSGASWASSSRGIREVAVPSIAIDPTDPAVLFAASRQGIHESRNGGGSWNVLAPLEPGWGSRTPDVEVIAFDPSNRSTLYAGGRGGVQKSSDGGRTWERKSLATDYIADLVIDPNNPRRVFAAYDSVFRTDNGAESWERVMTTENVASFYYPPVINAIAIAPSDDSVVYAGGLSYDYGNGFVVRSEDGGDGWSLPTTLEAGVTALAVDPCNPRILYAGTHGGVYRSADGGITWSEPGLTGVSVNSLALDPRHSSSVFAGTQSGVFWTNDSGASWTRFEPALTEPILSIAVDRSGRFLHAGTNQGVFDLERTFEQCSASADRLCLLGARFELTVTAVDPRSGNVVAGQGVPDGERFGYFSFPALTGDPRFPEVMVKMADATGSPAPYGGNVWAFHTAMTDLVYTLTIRDTQTGRVRIYHSDNFRPTAMACGEADTSAFAGECSADTLSTPLSDTGLDGLSGTDLALLGGRFRASLFATDPRTGRTAQGEAIAKANGFGYFSLPAFTGDPSFPEVFVKMTDGTALPRGHFWVFHTGLTDLDYTLTVTDQVTGAVRTYRRGAPQGPELCGEADTSAFRN